MAKTAKYSVELDASQAQAQAKKIGAEISKAMNQGASAGSGGRAGGALNGVAGAALGGVAGYFTVRGIQQIGAGAKAWADYSRAATNAGNALAQLQGSARAAATTTQAIQRAADYSIDSFQAMQIANKQLALGLVETDAEFERLVNVAKTTATVVGVDLTAALDAINLSAANLRTARLDEIGISATETKERFEELRLEMDDSRAMLLSILEVGESTFGGIDPESSGFAQLAATISDLKDDAIGAGTTLDMLASKAALLGREWVIGTAALRDGYEIVGVATAALTSSQQEAQQAIREAIEAYDIAALRDAIDAYNAAGAAAEPLAKHMYELSDAQKQANREAHLANQAFIEAAGGIDELTKSASQFLFLNLPGGLSAAAQSFNSLQNTLNQYTPSAIAAQRNQTDYGASTVQYSISAENQRDLKRVSYENIKATKDAQIKEWQSASRKMAEDFAAEFESTLQGIPGLFGASGVTQDDLDAAASGTYVEKVDEYLRQLNDEVLNGKDYAGVDIYDAAGRLGISGDLPADEILRQFNAAWEDSSLFAGGQNLDLLNADAVKAGIDRQQASKSGEEAIIAYFDAMYGPGTAEGAIGAPTDNAQSYIGGFEGAMQTQIENEDTQAPFIGFGDTLVGLVYKGFYNGAGEYDWVAAILANAQAQAADSILDALDGAATGDDAGAATP